MSTFLLVMALGCGSSPDEWNTSRTEGVGDGPTAAQNGLLGTYFDNSDFTNQVLERVDSTVDFNWGSGSPDSTIGANSFSVRWTGFVRAEFSESYTFYTVSDDGVRLWVNDQLVIDNWTDHAPREDKGAITLEAGKVYSIKMEFYENGGGAVAKLLWSSPSVAKQVIPGERLVTQLESDSEQHCVQVNENSTATLSCPSGQTITSIDFASYGIPTGACDAGFEVGTCHATSSTSKVEASCLNQQSCNVLAKNTVFGDPCPGKYKNIAVVFTCSGSQTEDKCPQDPNKSEPGECGCGILEGSCSEAVITASGENTRAGETKDKAFDGKASTKWLTFADVGWIQYDYPGDATKVITQYSITSANDHAERDPRDWKLLGSNDGTQFTTVDERSGETFSGRFQKKTFAVSYPGSFKMYRLDIVSNFNPPAANSTQLAELELVEGTATDDCPSDPNKTVAGICGCGTPDTDSDADGTPDCNDNCANDPKKIEPGNCGCGKAEGTCITVPITPFDANATDLRTPQYWSNRYGKTPEIVVASNGSELDVLAQDYDTATAHTAALIHIAPVGNGYGVTDVDTSLPMLDRVMGLAVDTSGNRYYATGVDETLTVNSEYPPLNTWRPDIVRVVKLDPSGNVLFNIDLDIARHDFKATAEPIINPMTAATARLAVGGNEVALVHGINTAPDWNLNGARHQKALSTRLDAATGAVTRVSSIWVSHSFDQRLLYDGSGIVELHLGDAYPRQIAMGRDHKSYPLFHIKGSLGANETRTRLGNMAVIEGDSTFGYIALFSTENTASTDATISGARNLAIVRINATDNSLDPSLPDALTVSSSGKDQTNRLKWITGYTSESGLHAERPKLIGIGNGKYIVLWEEWTTSGPNGVMAMVIDDRGNQLVPAKLITTETHLHRGDDAFLLKGKAGWMTGTASTKQLQMHLVDESLHYQVVTF